MSRGHLDFNRVAAFGVVTAAAAALVDEVVPVIRLKPLALVLVGSAASLIWLELGSRLVVLHIRREYAALERLLTEYEAFDTKLSVRLRARIGDLQAAQAPRSDIAAVKRELDEFRRQYTRVFTVFRERTADLMRQIYG